MLDADGIGVILETVGDGRTERTAVADYDSKFVHAAITSTVDVEERTRSAVQARRKAYGDLCAAEAAEMRARDAVRIAYDVWANVCRGTEDVPIDAQ